MTYRFGSLQRILDAFNGDELLSPTQISQRLGKNRWLVHKYLHALVDNDHVRKIGLGAHTKYQRIHPNKSATSLVTDLGLTYDETERLQQIFFKFDETGKVLQWVTWFEERCRFRGLAPSPKARDYLKLYEQISHKKNTCGVLDATASFRKHVDHLFLDRVTYIDQYTRLEFGRGKLAEVTYYAKQSQNAKLINQAIDMIFLQLQCVIRTEKIDAFAIVPRSIIRVNQLLKVLKDRLQVFWLPFVPVTKYFANNIPIPQKSLKTREQRIRNAQETIIVQGNVPYKKILLIDDFVGSGATLNETAAKLKHQWAKNVIGCAFVGNVDLSYEVINEI